MQLIHNSPPEQFQSLGSAMSIYFSDGIHGLNDLHPLLQHRLANCIFMLFMNDVKKGVDSSHNALYLWAKQIISTVNA